MTLTDGSAQPTQHYDVAVIGTTMAGSMLAAILARQGLRVALLDPGIHPRFALGETGNCSSSFLFEMLAERYNVPEFKALTRPSNIWRNVSKGSGVHKNVNWIYQRDNRPTQHDEVAQIRWPRFLVEAEVHYFRQDVDAFLLHTAIHHGASDFQRAKITGITADDSGVTITLASGGPLRARFVADASNERSPVAQFFGLRENPTRLKSHTRTIYTHMVGVKPFEDCLEGRPPYGNHNPWSAGTLYHGFEGGWLWVIPFNNDKHSTNPLVSVGVTLDEQRYPATGLPPEEEFAQIVARFPDVAAQFAEAHPVREWGRSGRQQYSSQHCFGARYCVIDQAAGYADPYLGCNLIATARIVNSLARRLLDVLKDNRFSVERFADLEQLQQSLVDDLDNLLHVSLIGTRSFPLWFAGMRAIMATISFFDVLVPALNHRFRQQHDPSLFDELDTVAQVGLVLPDETLQQVWQATIADYAGVADGTIDPLQVPDHISKLFADTNYIPPFHKIGDTSKRFFEIEVKNVPHMIPWLLFVQRSRVREIHKMLMPFIIRSVLNRKTIKDALNLRELKVKRPSPARLPAFRRS